MNRLTWLIVLILACLSVLITIALIWRHYAEPTYEGRTLSKWLASGASPSSLELSNSQHAIRQIGTNAIPCLLRWMSFEPSPLRYKILGLSSRLPGTLPQKVYPYLSGRSQDQLAQAAQFGLRTLGPEARSAAPELARLAITARYPERASSCAGLLSSLGPDALPGLVAVATSTNLDAARCAAGGIASFGTNALPHVPTLLRALHGSRDEPAYGAVTALGALHLWPSTVVPELTLLLDPTNHDIRRFSAVNALPQFGYEAKSAVPALQNALTDPDTQMRSLARKALTSIAPEALTNLPPQLDHESSAIRRNQRAIHSY